MLNCAGLPLLSARKHVSALRCSCSATDFSSSEASSLLLKSVAEQEQRKADTCLRADNKGSPAQFSMAGVATRYYCCRTYAGLRIVQLSPVVAGDLANLIW